MGLMDWVSQDENRSCLGHEKAAWAVDRARRFLQDLGFSIEPPKGVCVQGPDLFGYRGGGATVYFEVKLAMKNGRGWRVNRVTRKEDDYICIVFPCGHVQIESMKDHLRLCAPSGDRWITAMARVYE